MRKGRQSLAIINDRREAVKEMVVDGITSNQIKQVIMADFNVSLATVESDLTVVYKEIEEWQLAHRDRVIALHIARYEKIYKKAMDNDDNFHALKAMRQKEELLNLLKQQPLIAVQNNNMNFDKFTIEEIQKMLNGIDQTSIEDSKT